MTKRTIAELNVLLADNTTGAISEEDMRDVVDTLHAGHGEIFVSSAAATTISDTANFFAAAGTYTLSDSHDWDMNTNGQLRYTGVPTRTAAVTASFSITCDGNNKVIDFAVAKNGTVVTSSIQRRKIGTGADIGTGALHAHTDVDNGDYFEFVVRNTTSSTNITLQLCNIYAEDAAT